MGRSIDRIGRIMTDMNLIVRVEVSILYLTRIGSV
jgi:hypothetical protein